MNDKISLAEAVALGAADGAFYSQFFFPRTVRQNVPEMHRSMWERLDDPTKRAVAFKVFRDGAKTTLLRLFTSRRIAYGVSHTIVYTSNSELHAVRSLKWLRRQVEYNRAWAEAFGLRKGSKWSDSEIEIIHGVDEYPISVVAVGITGQVRGINLDDYRPDLVVGDDLDNEETTATPEQRKKSHDLFFGALYNGLAPASEAPTAKIVLLQTPLAEGDLIDTAAKDPSFSTAEFGCFDENGLSRWEERYPTKVLQEEKKHFIERGQLSLWMREKECKIVGDELAAFRRAWLKYWEVLPEGGWYRLAIDPAISDSKDADYWAISLVYFHGQKRYLVDYALFKTADPDAALARLFEFIFKYNPRQLVVETVAFQKVLAWILRKAMQHNRKYVTVVEHDDKRRKADVILQAFLNVAPDGNFYIREGHTEFITAFCTWFPGYKGHDDLLDATARCMTAGFLYDDTAIEAEFRRLDDEIPDLAWERPAP